MRFQRIGARVRDGLYRHDDLGTVRCHNAERDNRNLLLAYGSFQSEQWLRDDSGDGYTVSSQSYDRQYPVHAVRRPEVA